MWTIHWKTLITFCNEIFDFGQKYIMHCVTDKLSTQCVYIRREVRTWRFDTMSFRTTNFSISEYKKTVSKLSGIMLHKNNRENEYVA